MITFSSNTRAELIDFFTAEFRGANTEFHGVLPPLVAGVRRLSKFDCFVLALIQCDLCVLFATKGGSYSAKLRVYSAKLCGKKIEHKGNRLIKKHSTSRYPQNSRCPSKNKPKTLKLIGGMLVKNT